MNSQQLITLILLNYAEIEKSLNDLLSNLSKVKNFGSNTLLLLFSTVFYLSEPCILAAALFAKDPI